MSQQPKKGNPQREGDVQDVQRPRTEKPRKFKVILHNDDFTTMDFVILVLMEFFHKSEAEATHIMLTVHHKGQAIAGVYSRDIAETKVEQVTSFAQQQGMPLKVTSEPE